MVSVEWLQSIVSGPPAIIQQAKEKLHMAIAALSRNSGEAEQQQQEGSNTIKNFARTTMLTRMINGYLALEAASDTPVVCGPRCSSHVRFLYWRFLCLFVFARVLPRVSFFACCLHDGLYPHVSFLLCTRSLMPRKTSRTCSFTWM